MSEIIEAVARLQSAFHKAGLREPVALVLAGEEQVRLLEYVAASHFGSMMRPGLKPSWEGTAIRGMKIIHSVAP